MLPNYIHLDAVGSTNTWLRDNAATLPHASVVTATTQTAGRGQRGNTWESEPGANLTFSILLRPHNFPAYAQFLISEAVSLGIVTTLQPLIPHNKVSIKWPNDIYVDDMKICGILIENSIVGSDIDHSIAGIGINVNQKKFLSDAPNPVSLIQLTDTELALEPLLHSVVDNILSMLNKATDELHDLYLQSIYSPERSRYRTPDGIEFEASIHSIAPDGMLSLCHTADNSIHTYAFKEVARVITKKTL